MYSLYNYFLNRKWSGPVWGTAFRFGLRLRAAFHAARELQGSLFSRTPHTKIPGAIGLRKILIIRIDRVGDIVLSMPALAALRSAFPAAEIDILVQSKFTGLLNNYFGWTRVIGWNDIDDDAERARLASELRAQGYDVVIVSSTATAGYRIAREAGIPVRIGWRAKGFGHTLSVAIPDDRATANRHQVENNLKLLEPLGISDPKPTFPVRETESGKAQSARFLAEHGISPDEKILVLHPGSFSPRVRWAPEKFAEVAERATAQGMRTVLLGSGATERDLVGQIWELSGRRAVKALNAFDLEGLFSFLAHAQVFVGNSTGPMHVAASAGAWTIAVFGSRYPLDRHELWRPWGPKGVVVESKTATCCGMPWTCRDMACLREIPAQQVWEVVADAWDRPNAH
jgi:ADP-heptose:LPS heptosyltransferase